MCSVTTRSQASAWQPTSSCDRWRRLVRLLGVAFLLVGLYFGAVALG
jgi:hypothetical protein